MARELVVASDADAAAAAMVRALASYAADQRWDSSVIGDEPLRQSLVAWSKEAAAEDKEWLASQQQQQKAGTGRGVSFDVVEELQRLSQSLQRWTRHARSFSVLVVELVAHVRQCAAAVAAADRLRGKGGGGGGGGGLSGDGGGGGDDDEVMMRPWTKEERAELKAAMAKYPKGESARWEKVAKEFEGRRTTDEIRRFVAEMVVAVRHRNNK